MEYEQFLTITFDQTFNLFKYKIHELMEITYKPDRLVNILKLLDTLDDNELYVFMGSLEDTANNFLNLVSDIRANMILTKDRYERMIKLHDKALNDLSRIKEEKEKNASL